MAQVNQGSIVINPAAPQSYRSAITAADVLAAPGTVTCTKQAGGSVTANTYYITVVAVNAYGRTTGTDGDVTVTTETTNLTVRAAFAAVTGATHYDIYVSTDTDPKWVGRITEAQRASGIKITAVGVTGAGGTAGAVDVEVPGTGLQSAITAAQNTAFSIPSGVIACNTHQYVDFDLTFSYQDSGSPALTVIPAFKNTRTGTWFFGAAQSIAIGGQGGAYESLLQRIRVEARGNSATALLVAKIGGLSASLDIDYTLS